MTRDEVCKDSRALSEELDKIMEVIKNGDGNEFDTVTCWEKVKQTFSASHDATTWCLPTFHATKTLVKVKSSDLGYIWALFLSHSNKMLQLVKIEVLDPSVRVLFI